MVFTRKFFNKNTFMKHTKENLPALLASSIRTYFVNLGMLPQEEIEDELLVELLSQIESDPAFKKATELPEYKNITKESAKITLSKKDFFIFASKFLNHKKLQDIVFNFLVDEKFKLENITVKENLLTKSMDFASGTASFEDLRVEVVLFAWKKTFSTSVVRYPCVVLLKTKD
jgi:hypothetical protein